LRAAARVCASCSRRRRRPRYSSTAAATRARFSTTSASRCRATLLEYATDVRFFHALRESFAAAADRALRAAAAQHAAAAALGAAVARRLDDAQGLLFTSDDREANVRVDAALVGDLAAAAGCAPALDGAGAGAAQLRPSGVAAPGAPAFRSKPCRNFAAGHCRFGDACAFRH
jgi:hypothetical protein